MYIAIGDEIVVNGASFLVIAVNANLTVLISTIVPAFGPTTDYFINTRDLRRSPQGHNKIYALYQPPIGLFDVSDNLGVGVG